MQETRFAELKRYVGFVEADARMVAELGAVASPHLEGIARAFYERTREHEEAHAVFRDEAQIDRLQQSLIKWMRRLLGGVYDEGYYAESSKIGAVHVRVGLPQRYMFTAMSLVREELAALAERELGARSGAVRRAVDKLLDVELAVLMESYNAALLARIRRMQDEDAVSISQAMARTEHRYVTAVELAQALVIGLDRNGTIRLFNRCAEDLTGYERDEAFGMSFVDTFVAEGHRSAFTRAVEVSHMDGAQRSTVETVLRSRQGKLRDILWQISFAPSDLDDEVVTFAVGLDRTEERLLAERTRQTEKLAAVGTLAAGLAHEIRNPLNGAQLHTAYLSRELRKAGAAKEAHDAVEVVSDEIKRLAALVTEFLDFARPKPLAVKTLSAQALCARVVSLCEDGAKKGGVTVNCDVPEKELSFDGDGAKLEQVLLNLTGNAIEALDATGGGQVVLRVRRQPRTVTFEVEDDGPGLPSEDAPVFDAFYSTKPQGTGLGLAITHRIVTDHGGSVDVDSVPGRTVFRVTLPIHPPGKHTGIS